MHRAISLVVFGAVVASGQRDFTCPDNGFFEDHEFCDKYYDCYDGSPETRLCPDGLVFDPFSRKAEPCDHYFNVDCGDRLQLQEPKGTNDLCPRLNGFYAHPDPSICNVFFACVDGMSEEYTCSPGLWFDEYKGVCNWPLDSERGPNCKSRHEVTESGFQCPERSADEGSLGLIDPHPKYADPEDCAKFFVCLNGIAPRSQGCELGLVYNTLTKQCDSPESVPECKDYYAFLEDENGQLPLTGAN